MIIDQLVLSLIFQEIFKCYLTEKFLGFWTTYYLNLNVVLERVTGKKHCLLLIHYELCTLCARSSINSLNMLQKYLSNCRQRTKVDFVYSSREVTLSGVTQVFILGPILLSIHIYVMF